MRIRKSTALTAILAVALVAIILVGTTLAYLTDTTTTTNVTYAFNANDVDVILEEPIWDSQKGESKYFEGDAALMAPGRKIIKDPQVTVLEDSAECYIRLKVTIDPDLATAIRTPIRVGDGWTVAQHKSETNTYYYYYPKILIPGETTTPAFDYVEVLTQDELDQIDPGLMDAIAKSGGSNIYVSAQVIQAYGFTYSQAMSVLDASEEKGELLIREEE